MLTHDQLYKALEMLGDSHAAVANRLFALGCKGVRLSMTSDPMAVFVRKITSPVEADSPFAVFIPKIEDEFVPAISVKTKPSTVSVTYANGKTVHVLPPMASILFMCKHDEMHGPYQFLTLGYEMRDIEKILEKLLALGNTVLEIAHALKDASCFGFRGSLCECPIASFLKKITGAFDISVKPDLVTLVFTGVDVIYFAPPAIITEFIGCYDANEFPFLNR